MVSIEDGGEEDNLSRSACVGVKAWSLRQIQKERLDQTDYVTF